MKKEFPRAILYQEYDESNILFNSVQLNETRAHKLVPTF